MPKVIPEVPDEEVLGRGTPDGGPAGAAASAGPRGAVRWLPWLIAGLLLLSVAWGLLVLTP